MVHTGNAPGSDDLDIGLETVECQFKTDLVVTLPGATVRNKAENILETKL